MADKNNNNRNVAISIISIFEDLLDENGITIPDKFRSGEEGSDEARIFGDTYYNLEDRITDLLNKHYGNPRKNDKYFINKYYGNPRKNDK